jgi:hypothetical protein
MSEMAVAGYRINFSSGAVNVSRTEDNGVTSTHTVFNNGEAKLERCKQISGKNICLWFKDKKQDKHGVSKIASEGLGKCFDAAKKAMGEKEPKLKAVQVVRACEAMYAFARSDDQIENPVKSDKPGAVGKPATKKDEPKAPEKPLKK